MEHKFEKYDVLYNSYMDWAVFVVKIVPGDCNDLYLLMDVKTYRIYNNVSLNYVNNDFVLLTDIFSE